MAKSDLEVDQGTPSLTVVCLKSVTEVLLQLGAAFVSVTAGCGLILHVVRLGPSHMHHVMKLQLAHSIKNEAYLGFSEVLPHDKVRVPMNE